MGFPVIIREMILRWPIPTDSNNFNMTLSVYCYLFAVAHYNSTVLSSLLLGLYTGGAGKEAGSGGL